MALSPACQKCLVGASSRVWISPEVGFGLFIRRLRLCPRKIHTPWGNLASLPLHPAWPWPWRSCVCPGPGPSWPAASFLSGKSKTSLCSDTSNCSQLEGRHRQRRLPGCKCCELEAQSYTRGDPRASHSGSATALSAGSPITPCVSHMGKWRVGHGV